MSDLTPPRLEEWLEWAGVRLIAMPGKRVGPNGYKISGLEYSQEVFQVLEFRAALPVKVAPPSNMEIPIIEEVLTLPNLIKDVGKRRVVRVRTLLHPINGRHLYKWDRITETLGRINGKKISTASVKYMYKSGLEEICKKIDADKVCSISNTLSNFSFFAYNP